MVHEISGNNPVNNYPANPQGQTPKAALLDLENILSDYTNVKNPIINDTCVARLNEDLSTLSAAYANDTGNNPAGNITGQCNLVLGTLNGNPPYDQNAKNAAALSSWMITTIEGIIGDAGGPS